MSNYDSESDSEGVQGITWMEILSLQNFAREHGYYDQRKPGPSGIMTTDPPKETTSYWSSSNQTTSDSGDSRTNNMETGIGMSYADDVTMTRQEYARGGQNITGLTHSTSVKINLGNGNSEKALKLVNGRYPNLKRLTLREIGGKAKSIIKHIKPRNIRALILENRATVNMGDQLNVLLKHFKDVRFLTLINCGSPLGDLEDGKYEFLKIRDGIFSEWHGMDFVLNNPQLRTFDAPRQFFWPWTRIEFQALNGNLSSKQINLTAMTFELNQDSEIKTIYEAASLSLKKFKLICRAEGAIYSFLRGLRNNKAVETVEMVLDNTLRNRKEMIKNRVLDVIGGYGNLSKVYLTVGRQRTYLKQHSNVVPFRTYDPARISFGEINRGYGVSEYRSGLSYDEAEECWDMQEVD